MVRDHLFASDPVAAVDKPGVDLDKLFAVFYLMVKEALHAEGKPFLQVSEVQCGDCVISKVLLLEIGGNIWILSMHHLDELRQAINCDYQANKHSRESSKKRRNVVSASQIERRQGYLEQIQEL